MGYQWIDFNVADPAPFAQAQQEILGESHAYPMIAFGTMKKSSAWKMYAKSQNVEFSLANEVSNQIQKYENALKHADEDDKDLIDIMDYIEPRFQQIYKQSEIYQGIITSWSIAPCAYLLYQGDIPREIGLVRIKDNLCCLMDGHWAEAYKFLKNDILTVKIVDLIYRVYERIGREPDSVNDLLKICETDNAIWGIYKKGCTIGINQVEQPGTSSRVGKYSPKNVSELCAFIAAIRPGFKSMYKQFESREPFSYGIKTFDNLIQTSEMPNSYLLYQEMTMAALHYAGIEMGETMTVVKAISKKRIEKIMSYKDRFLDGFAAAMMREEHKSEEESYETSHQVWKILEDSSRYQFNSSHSYCVALDSLYGAYLKSHYPLEFYEVFLTIQEEKGDKDKLNAAIAEAEDYFNIKFPAYRFGQDNRHITLDYEHHAITKSIGSIKGFSKTLGDVLFEASQHHYDYFVDLLLYLDANGVKTVMEKLIRIDYFTDFGNCAELLRIYEVFDTTLKRGTAKSVKKDKFSSDSPFLEMLSRHATDRKKDGSEAKSFTITDMHGLLVEIETHFKNAGIRDLSYPVKMQNQKDILGYVDLVTGKEQDRRKLLITGCRELSNGNAVWGYAIFTRSIGSGKQARMTVREQVFRQEPLKEMDIIYVHDFYKNKSGYWYLTDYDKLA